MKIKVLYEDKDVLGIDKPSGIAVHGDGRSEDKTIADWVLKNYPKMKNIGEPEFFENKGVKVEIKRPGIVHRLDRDTSGVMLLAKNKKAFEVLKKQFQDREVKKTYVAIVSGHVRNDRGIINKPIGRSPRDFRRYLSGRGVRGEIREAVTEYKVLKRFQAPSKFTYLEVYPKTGRTHQIRVHMKYLNHPVVCDSLYNPDNPCPKGLARMALHAKSIEFKDLKGKTIKVESSIPKEFKKIIG
ncbi:MAG: RluA family pseudouridine synthase [Patescibacteria group bacterium]